MLLYIDINEVIFFYSNQFSFGFIFLTRISISDWIEIWSNRWPRKQGYQSSFYLGNLQQLGWYAEERCSDRPYYALSADSFRL